MILCLSALSCNHVIWEGIRKKYSLFHIFWYILTYPWFTDWLYWHKKGPLLKFPLRLPWVTLSPWQQWLLHAEHILSHNFFLRFIFSHSLIRSATHTHARAIAHTHTSNFHLYQWIQNWSCTFDSFFLTKSNVKTYTFKKTASVIQSFWDQWDEIRCQLWQHWHLWPPGGVSHQYHYTVEEKQGRRRCGRRWWGKPFLVACSIHLHKHKQ